MSSKDVERRLLDIVENADRALSYIKGMDASGFAADWKTVDATERCVERIAEAVMKIGATQFAAIAPHVPFERIRGMGNMLRHAYDEIDLKLLFALVQTHVVDLRAAASRALET